jgi:hypothetical protein
MAPAHRRLSPLTAASLLLQAIAIRANKKNKEIARERRKKLKKEKKRKKVFIPLYVSIYIHHSFIF